MPSDERVAQTNLQLFNQLRDAGWSEPDLARIKSTYALATRILTNRYRPDGKSFVAHGIGTASVLASEGCAVDVVIAGLVHGAYGWGDWGEGSHAMTDTKRAAVREVVGAEAERVIAAYTRVQWGEAEAESVLARINELDAEERDMVMLKAANALDDHMELGMRYRGKTAAMVADDRVVLLTIEIAQRIGMTALADHLCAAREAELAADLPETLVAEGGYPFVGPLTHRRRLIVWFRANDSRLSRAAHRVTGRLPKSVRRVATRR
jgi:(p)ppGpp synthase/HD superfamily hydrolase